MCVNRQQLWNNFSKYRRASSGRGPAETHDDCRISLRFATLESFSDILDTIQQCLGK